MNDDCSLDDRETNFHMAQLMVDFLTKCIAVMEKNDSDEDEMRPYKDKLKKFEDEIVELTPYMQTKSKAGGVSELGPDDVSAALEDATPKLHSLNTAEADDWENFP